MQLDFITITVHVSPDAMEAHLELAPVFGAQGTLEASHLTEALEEAGVVRGVSAGALGDVVADWNANPRPVVTKAVASGVLPSPAAPGALRFMVKHLTAPGDIKAALGRTHFWEVASLSHKFQRVDQGNVIARRSAPGPGLLGYTVRGDPLKSPAPEPDGAGIKELNNVFIAGGTFTAATTGIVYVDDDGMPVVIPLNFDGVAEVEVAPDAMTAELVAYPAGERGSMPSEEFIRNLLKLKGVVFGLDEEEIARFMLELEHGIDSRLSVTAAEGIRAIKGDDGEVEFCFNVESSPAPTLNPDGSVDYKNINIVASVGVGTVLARLHPPKKGVPGMDVLGRPMPALDGNPVPLPAGSNTVIPKDNPNVIVSAADGIPRFVGGTVNVTEGYSIPGDVDYSTGNVNYDNSVAVNGDVKSGFDVRCGGDLQVNGLIEDCKVKVGGNVLCRYGFVGTGKGIIKAGGDVNLVYVKNQTIVSEGIVNIAKESIHANISARKAINIYGQRLSAVGGTLASTGAIVLKTVGNISGVRTTLRIDYDPRFVEEINAAKASIAQHEENIKKIAVSINGLPPEKKTDMELVRKLKSTIISIKQQAIALEEKIRVISTAAEKFENAFIRIDRLAYPGTIIQFGHKMQLTLHDMLTGGKTIRIVGGEIKIL